MSRIKNILRWIDDFFGIFTRPGLAFLLYEHYMTTGTAIAFYDVKKNRITRCNPSFEISTGYELEKLRSKKIEDLLWEKDEASIKKLGAVIEDLISGEEGSVISFVNSWKHGISKTEIEMYWLSTYLRGMIICEVLIKKGKRKTIRECKCGENKPS